MSHRSFGRRSLAAAFLAAGGLLAMLASPVAATTPGAVVVITAQGEVDGAMSSLLRSGLSTAADSQAAAVVIKLNTPGGTLTDMMDIVSAMLESRVPVIVWVAPSGGYAASAGTFITLAANLAYMAPGTRIGAASPIDSNGQDIPGTLGDKVRNDAIAFIRSIAETRHRPVDWADSTVSAARSSSALEAVSLGVVDGIASTIEEVVAQANGKTVTVNEQPVTLALAGAPIEDVGTNPVGGLVGFLANPNVAFLLFTVGVLALLFELQNPSLIVGVFGLVLIALSVIGFANLPTNLTGVFLDRDRPDPVRPRAVHPEPRPADDRRRGRGDRRRVGPLQPGRPERRRPRRPAHPHRGGRHRRRLRAADHRDGHPDEAAGAAAGRPARVRAAGRLGHRPSSAVAGRLHLCRRRGVERPRRRRLAARSRHARPGRRPGWADGRRRARSRRTTLIATAAGGLPWTS